MTWHPSSEQLVAYRDAALAATQTWSIETHVAGCSECRRAFDGSNSGRLEEIWQSTLDQIDAPRPRSVERGLTVLGVPGHLARLLAATPSLTVPWLLAVAAVLGFGLAMAWNWNGAGTTVARSGLFVFLLLAPLVPVAGVAVAFGPVTDPAHEVAVASPFHGFRLLLIRNIAVIGTSMSIALGLATLLPNAGLMALAWIVPAFTLVALTLAASTFVAPLMAAGGSMALWLGTVTLVEAGPNALVAFGWTGQFVSALVLIGAVAVLMVRRDKFEAAR